MKSGGKELTDDKIREELSEAVELSDESLEKVVGGNWREDAERSRNKEGDTREVYSMNEEDINKSIFGSLY